MQITHFKINQLRTAINLTVEDAASLASLSLWTNKTYKDYNKVIDLSTKLTGSSVENIVISLADINEPYFDGVYFIEAEDTDEISQAITADLTRYKECIVNKLAEYSVCEDCLQKLSTELQNAQGLLLGLEDAVEEGFIDETFNFVQALDKYCSNDCKSCGGYKNQPSGNYYSLPVKNNTPPVELVPFLVEGGNGNNNDVLFEILDGSTLIYSRLLTDTNTDLETIELGLNKIYTFKTTHPNIPNNISVVNVYLLDNCLMEQYFLLASSFQGPLPFVSDHIYNDIVNCGTPEPYPIIQFGTAAS